MRNRFAPTGGHAWTPRLLSIQTGGVRSRKTVSWKRLTLPAASQFLQRLRCARGGPRGALGEDSASGPRSPAGGRNTRSVRTSRGAAGGPGSRMLPGSSLKGDFTVTITKQGAAEHGAPSRKPRNGATHTHAERPECVSPKRVPMMRQRSHVTQTPLPTLSPSSAARGARARHRAEPLGLAGLKTRVAPVRDDAPGGGSWEPASRWRMRAHRVGPGGMEGARELCRDDRR